MAFFTCTARRAAPGLALLLAACSGDEADKAPGDSAETGQPSDSADTSSPDETGDTGDTGAPDQTRLLLTLDGFSTPESVRCAASGELCYVSNISGSPTAADGDGFISTITPDGALIALDAFPDAELNAPKGMALVGEDLWVTDIDSLRRIPLDGAAASRVGPIEGASFLNDLAADADGLLYASDSNTGAIYRLDPAGDGDVSQLLAPGVISSANGLTVHDGALYVVSYARAGGLFQLSLDGAVEQSWESPAGQLDGIEISEEGTFYLTSWASEGVWAGSPDGGWTLSLDGLSGPADLGRDAVGGHLLVPLFSADAVAVIAPGGA